MRRFVLLVCVALVPFTILTCTSARYSADKEVFCRSGNYSKSRPLICVDERTLTANPSRAHIYDVESKNRRATGRAVTIHWFSQHTADLRITMKTEGCTAPVQCDGLGHCMTTVNKLREGEKNRVCTYGMTIGDQSIDPDGDIVIDPCCP